MTTWKTDLEAALKKDHSCGDYNCAINAAIVEGFFLSALRLMSTVTEWDLNPCATFDSESNRIYEKHIHKGTFASEDEVSEEWSGWVKWFSEHFGKQCPTCHRMNRTESLFCTNCSRELGTNT